MNNLSDNKFVIATGLVFITLFVISNIVSNVCDTVIAKTIITNMNNDTSKIGNKIVTLKPRYNKYLEIENSLDTNESNSTPHLESLNGKLTK